MSESQPTDELYEMVGELEASISEGFVTGETEHPRLQAMLSELEAESEQQRVQGSVDALFKKSADSDSNAHLQQALIDHLVSLRLNHGVEIASLQLHTLGIYRALRSQIKSQRGWEPSLDDLRTTPLTQLQALSQPLVFGSSDFVSQAIAFPAQVKRAQRLLRLWRRQVAPRTDWHEPALSVELDSKMETALAELPAEKRAEAHSDIVRKALSNRFYKAVFVHYFDRDTFDPAEYEHYPTVADWLSAVAETPHLFSFMQGYSSEGKPFRVVALANKLIQLLEIAVRIDTCRQEKQGAWTDISFKEGMRLAAKEQIPVLETTPELIASAITCPLPVLVDWVQERLSHGDFVLPSDPRRR